MFIIELSAMVPLVFSPTLKQTSAEKIKIHQHIFVYAKTLSYDLWQPSMRPSWITQGEGGSVARHYNVDASGLTDWLIIWLINTLIDGPFRNC